MTELVLVKRREEKGKKNGNIYCMNERELKNLKDNRSCFSPNKRQRKHNKRKEKNMKY